MKNTLKQALRAVIPILVYGVYGYFTKEWTFEWENFHTENNRLYGRALDAISNSNMSSCYKSQALRGLQNNKPDEYYEAAIAIAKGNMASCYKAVAICGLKEQF
ncbi:MAG: hypothetical protein HFG80_05990 [Eubacterium sp.]|nr:hypothetical protein [Eubacterium sp.]